MKILSYQPPRNDLFQNQLMGDGHVQAATGGDELPASPDIDLTNGNWRWSHYVPVSPANAEYLFWW